MYSWLQVASSSKPFLASGSVNRFGENLKIQAERRSTEHPAERSAGGVRKQPRPSIVWSVRHVHRSEFERPKAAEKWFRKFVRKTLSSKLLSAADQTQSDAKKVAWNSSKIEIQSSKPEFLSSNAFFPKKQRFRWERRLLDSRGARATRSIERLPRCVWLVPYLGVW